MVDALGNESHSRLTNEERRLEIYTGADKPVEPQYVTSTTPLEDLNLNWRECDPRERERTKHVHRLHPYLGKFIPQLVEVFLRKYFIAGQTVIDPFCGSGTALVQANELGIHSIGCDISAFNVLLSKAKAQHYFPDVARIEILDALDQAKRDHSQISSQLSIWNDSHDTSQINIQNEYMSQWYSPGALAQLLQYRNVIYAGNYLYADLLKIVLSRSARSARLTTHFELDFPKKPQVEPYWCYKHRRICTPTSEALKFIERYSLDTIKRIAECSLVQTDAQTTVVHGDSRTVKFPLADGIITSPPYVGLIDYHEQHAYAYALLGLEDNRIDEIGPAVAGSSSDAKAAYLKDMVSVFQNVLMSIRSGGVIIVVAADKADLYPRIASQLGVDEIATVKRHVNRRTGMRASQFYESIFIWGKNNGSYS